MKRLSMRKVVMIGTSLESPGGMTAVVQLYREAGLFATWNVSYLSSFERPELACQLRVMTRALWQFLMLLLGRKVALLHVHSASRGSFWRKSVFCALARAFGVPYVFHIHSGEFPFFVQNECGTWARRWVEHTLRQAKSVVALTAGWCTSLQALVPGANVVVLGNPVVLPTGDVTKRQTLPHVVFLGRLREKKGVFDLVAAIPRVLEKIPEARFTLAGDGELAAVSEMSRRLGVGHAIHLPGWIDGMKKEELLASAAVLVLPSYFEGFPVCILEAMVAGVSVVSTSVGGIPEVLDGGACGALVSPGDIEALAEALIEILGNREYGDAMRQRAFAKAKDCYSVQAILGALGDLYDRAIICPEIK